MKKLFIVCLMAGIFSGCTTGTLITKDGTTDNPKWHSVDKVVFNKDLGTFPNLQSLSQVRTGMTKDQLYELIGRPQYDDGWRPREWNYLFHFTTPGQGDNDITTCQFKVLFDQNKFARSFYWNPIHPEGAVCPPPVGGPKETVSIKRYTLGADALFAFDKSDLQNLNPKGRDDLDRLSSELENFKTLHSIRVLGYTDRLGTQNYNLRLSQNRANTIKQYLVYKGVNPQIISAIGYGADYPIKECANKISREELIKCLAPNRRVIVEVDGYIEER